MKDRSPYVANVHEAGPHFQQDKKDHRIEISRFCLRNPQNRRNQPARIVTVEQDLDGDTEQSAKQHVAWKMRAEIDTTQRDERSVSEHPKAQPCGEKAEAGGK